MAAAWDDRSAEGQISAQNLSVMNSHRKGLVPGLASGTKRRFGRLPGMGDGRRATGDGGRDDGTAERRNCGTSERRNRGTTPLAVILRRAERQRHRRKSLPRGSASDRGDRSRAQGSSRR